MKHSRIFVILLVLGFALLAAPHPLRADEYDDSQSHPLRVAAYLLHPVGVLLEWTIFRPLHAVVSGTEELEYVFGHNPHPPLFAEPQPVYDYGVSKKVPLKPAEERKAAVTQAPATREKVTVVEVPVEKIVVKEVPKIVEVERVVFPDVAFRFDSAELTDLGKGKVYLAAQKLKGKSDVVVVLEGHTDSIGSDPYNQRLGLQRAQAIMNELVRLGIDPGRMSAVSLGESKPAIDEQADWARAVNRRVEFQVKVP